jgi:TnpA family transposase
MAIWLTTELKLNILKIIEAIWEKKLRVTYRDFVDILNKTHPSDNPIRIPKQTFSRLLQEFLQEKSIKKYRNSELRSILQELLQVAIHKGIHEREELKNYVNNFLRAKKIYSPPPSFLERIIGTIANEIMINPEAEDIHLISEAIGRDISSIEFVKDFLNNNRYSRFPPAYDGKIGIKKLTSEYKIALQIQELFRNEGIELSKLLQLSGIHLSKELIEKLHPSDMVRFSKPISAIHLLKYYVARFQDSIDAIVKCFIKTARLMRFRANKSYDESSGKNSRSFLEQNNAQFQEILDAMKTDDIVVLEDYKEFFELVAKTTGYYNKKEGYFDALASRYTYSRILSPKISFLEFKGLDESSTILLEVLKEVFKYEKFKTDVSNDVISRLGFIKVPVDMLKNRRVFEPLILATLADFISSGRIIVKHSIQYRNKWDDVSNIDIDEEQRKKSVDNMKSDLENIWNKFSIYVKNHPEICDKGRINEKRLPSSTGKDDDIFRKAKIDAFVESLEVKDIIEILWSVHETTGFLDAFKIVNKSYHGNILTDEERGKLAMITVLARGMNIGLKGIVKSLQGKYGIGRLISFDENYVSIENLEDANRTIIRKWDALNCGSLWGDGCGCSSDGKVIFSFINNMLSRFHYRKGRMGVTVYWFVRNDWIANYVQVIGNDEWESWYVIDGLLNSYCDKEVRQSCGDTQGQLLSLWGLGTLLGLDIRARFRAIKNVNLYKSNENCLVDPLTDIDSIDWEAINKCISSLLKLVNAIKSRKISSKEFLSTWNFYDEKGINVAEGLREIGKVYRTKFILKYLMNKELQQDIREGCNRAEFWNKFQDAVFWGNGGIISSNNIHKQHGSALFLMLIMNAIVFYNKTVFGAKIENDLNGVTMHPAFWQHINFIGKYNI